MNIIIKKNNKDFISIIDILSNFNDETNFTFKKDFLSVKVIDRSGISICNIILNKSFFEEYEITDEKTYTLNLEMLLKIVKKVGKKEINVKVMEDGIVFSNNKDKFKLNYYVGQEDDRQKPSQEVDNIWNIDCGDFFSNIEDLVDFSDICRIYSDGENIKISTRANLTEGDILLDGVKEKGASEDCWYDIGQILKVVKMKGFSNKVKLYFGKDKPINLVYETEMIKLDWMLAPRVRDG